jgi:hypothetical protein
VGGLAHGRVVHPEVISDGADHDLAGVEPDSNIDGQAFDPAQTPGVLLDRVLHAQRRIAGADGMVLVRERGAEERHDPVPHHLVDGPLVPMDGLHHPLEDRVEHLARFLGIAVGQQLHRALDVGEEDRDLLAFAGQGFPGGQDPLGQMPGRVRLGRDRLRRDGASRQRPATVVTELVGVRVPGPTCRTHHLEPGPALPTKLSADRILALTPGALHAGPPAWWGV